MIDTSPPSGGKVLIVAAGKPADAPECQDVIWTTYKEIQYRTIQLTTLIKMVIVHFGSGMPEEFRESVLSMVDRIDLNAQDVWFEREMGDILRWIRNFSLREKDPKGTVRYHIKPQGRKKIWISKDM